MAKQLGLNLGCGRVHFPTDPTNQKIAHLVQYLLAECIEAFGSSDIEWLNVDRAEMPGIENADLFSYPWIRKSTGRPFEDDSADIIWASHLVEHIPHRAELNEFAYDELKKAARVDGWYAWFMEAWRVLKKPGGVIHLVVPYAFSAAAVGDPSHTRYLIPETFSYFAPSDGNPFDYQIPFRFDATGNARMRLIGEVQRLYDEYDPIYQECLSARAGGDPNAEKLEAEAMEKLIVIQNKIKHSVSVVEEFYIGLRAAKPD